MAYPIPPNASPCSQVQVLDVRTAEALVEMYVIIVIIITLFY